MKRIAILLATIIISFTTKNLAQDFKSSSSDSTQASDPQPVVITQDGYDPNVIAGDKPVSERTFKERLKYGGSLGPFSFSNYGSVIGISPMLGYMLTDKTIVGVGVSYIFYTIKDPFTKQKAKNDLIGYRAFIRQDLPFTQKINFPLFATVEAEQYQGVQVKGKYQPALLAGLGLGRAGGYGLTLLYDFNYNYDKSYTSSPIVIRVNGFFN